MIKKCTVLMVLYLCSFMTYAYCIEEWACIESQRTSTGVEFWASNKKAFTITVTLDVKTSNLRNGSRQSNRYNNTLVLTGNQRKRILKLDRIIPDKRHWFSDSFHWTPGNMHAIHDDVTYQYPYDKNSYYRIVQGFGGGFSHRGASRYAVDFAMPVGTPIHAARNGIVIDLVERHDKGGPSRRYSKFANFITIEHSDGTTGEYYHLKQNGVVVKLGDNVKTGQLIGYSGNTGFSSLPHLHFAVYRAKSWGDYESLPFRFAKR